ncbi:P63C domain-containing protein [Achromobacter xylosoxidans]|uniref:P63C domain-containing protein n=1 Tax=Alcaligenes xylosoxydans xylosoxydans TaxID=85698 RepID=UPI0038FC5C2D
MPSEKKSTLPKKTPAKRAGGLARAEKLTPERRKEIAKMAATARHGLRATHRGNFEADFGIDVECFVLNDDKKTAVIHQRGMSQAIGLGEGGSKLPRFVSGKTISEYVGPELRQKLDKPLIFQAPPAGPGVPPVTVHGYDVTVLIDLCKAIISAEADGKLQTNQAHVARQAHIILAASAKAGIKGLVYALSGYDATREEVVAAFKSYVAEEAREYEREFPPQLYENWYRLYQIQKPERGRPWKAKHLTIDHIYHPLARSSGRVLELMRALKAQGDDRNKKLHQFLSDMGVKALRMHVGQLLGIAGISRTVDEYEQHVRTLFGDQLELPGVE